MQDKARAKAMTKNASDIIIAREIAQLYSENYANFGSNAVINEMRSYAEVIHNPAKVYKEIKTELKAVYNIQ